MENTAKRQKQIKKFKNNFLFTTEFVSYFILVPLIFLYLYVNSGFNEHQLSLFIKLTTTSVVISMITTYINDRIVISPIILYFNKDKAGDDVSSQEYKRAQQRFFALPFIHSIGSVFRWIFGLGMVLVPMTIFGDLKPTQSFNIWMTLLIMPPLSLLLYFLLTELFMQKLLDVGIFTKIAIQKMSFRITFQLRIIVSILVIVFIPVIAVIGYFMLFIEKSNITINDSLFYVRLGVILVFGIATALSIAIPLVKSVKSRIFVISNFLHKVGKGDLSAEKQTLAVMDELTNINQVIYFMKKNITDMIGNIRSISNQLEISSKEISAITDSFSTDTQNQAATMQEVTATITEISAGMSVVWLGAYEQFQSLEFLVSKIKDLSDTIHDLEEKIGNTQALTRDISEQASFGAGSLQQMNTSMQTIGQSSNQMTGIISIINDISDSINLLSLNAAIEAARAGDAGRGFAVVADEISKLAENTAQSVKEIDILIKSNDQEITAGMSMVKDVVDRISKIISGVEGFNVMITSISNFVKKQVEVNDIINQEIRKIKNRSEEIQENSNVQKSAVQEISDSIDKINTLTQAISSGSVEIAANTKENAHMADILKDKVDQFKIT